MTLTMLRNQEATKATRWKLLKYIARDKKNLAYAYASGSPARVLAIKYSLIRHLREIAESPELGAPPEFKYGIVLTALMDIHESIPIPWPTTYPAVAYMFEQSLNLHSGVSYE